MAYHQPGDKTEAIYVSNLKGDNTKFYRFFRVAEREEEEGEGGGGGRCCGCEGCAVLPEIAVVEEEGTEESGGLKWKWKVVIIPDTLFVEGKWTTSSI